MEYVNLADTGITVSRVCLGMMSYGDRAWQDWVLDEAAGCGFVRQALDLGITMFDTADAYSGGESEAILGRAVRGLGSRDGLVIATKGGLPVDGRPGGLSPAYLNQAIDASLLRLGLQHVDLYQAHGWDPDVPVADTMGALADIVQAGKARAVGACNFAAWQMAVANQADRTRLSTMQVQLNLLHREEQREMLPCCSHLGVAPLAYSPLARGRMASARTTHEQRRALSDRKGERLYGNAEPGVSEALATLAKRRNQPAAQLALGWVLGTAPVAVCIVGATEPAHLVQASAATSMRLTPDERALLEAPYTPRWPELGDLSGRVS